MNRDDDMPMEQYAFPGGVYDIDDKDRTDFELEDNTIKNEDGELVVALDMHIVTGNGVFSLGEIPPETVADLGKWLIETAKQVLARK